MSLLSSPDQNISFIHYTEDEIINDPECKKSHKLITHTHTHIYMRKKNKNVLFFLGTRRTGSDNGY